MDVNCVFQSQEWTLSVNLSVWEALTIMEIVIKLATERTQSADEDCVILPRALEKLLTEPLQM